MPILTIADLALDIFEAAFDVWNEFYQVSLDLLTQNPDSIFGGKLWLAIETIVYTLRPIGYSLLAIFLYLGVIQSGLNFVEFKRIQIWLPFLFRCICTKTVLDYGPSILLDVIKAFISMITLIQSAVVGFVSGGNGLASGGYIEMSDVIADKISNAEWQEALVYCAIGILTWAVFLVLSLTIVLTVYPRIFKIMAYAAVSPVSLSTFGSRGTSFIGSSFVKSFLGVCAEGVVIALFCVIFNIYVDSSGQDYLDAAMQSTTMEEPCFTVSEHNTKIIVTENFSEYSYKDEREWHDGLYDKYYPYLTNNSVRYYEYTFESNQNVEKEQLISDFESCTCTITYDAGFNGVLMYIGRCIFMMLVLCGSVKAADATTSKLFGMSG